MAPTGLVQQAYHPSTFGGTPEMYASGGEEIATSKPTSDTSGDPAARHWLELQQQQTNNQHSDNGHPFFDFEPLIEADSSFPPQYPSLSEPSLTPGWNAMAPQVPSPPDSATSPPPSWQSFPYQPSSSVHNILTDMYTGTRVQFGQNTPPDDNFPNMFTVPGQFQNPSTSVQEPSSPSTTKRKRSSTSGQEKATAPKRSRKNGRSTNLSNGQPASSAEEVRRHKFLERNRVAASKCRQKKKEWTQNLENRARELQKENNHLRMLVDSLRDELVFIKGEILKHTSCESDNIQGWLKSSAASSARSPVIKREHSPINSAPPSRYGSVSSHGDEPDHDQDAPAPDQEAPVLRSEESQILEGLLREHLAQDTSEEAIASAMRTTE
ncbi:MAG: hypothetical protein L6R37_001848 [Teloschistes peruensis]|nr:MAG: hypothetical protein L6R37_001848 [Teloschistes peruensis]